MIKTAASPGFLTANTLKAFQRSLSYRGNLKNISIFTSLSSYAELHNRNYSTFKISIVTKNDIIGLMKRTNADSPSWLFNS